MKRRPFIAALTSASSLGVVSGGLIAGLGAQLGLGKSAQAQTAPRPNPSSAARESDYPNKPIRLVVPYPPGGGTDVIARIVTPKMAELMGQQIIIDNKGGAGGSVGTALVAKSAPDGYTALFTLSSHTINPAIYAKLSFDTIADFESVGMVASLPQILVAHPSAPYNDVAEYLAWGKKNPITFASVGNGSPSHLAGELLAIKSGVPMVHVPYRGAGPAIVDLLGNQVTNGWVSIPAAAQHVKSGKLKGIAVSTVNRAAAFPDLKTVKEQGFADFEVDSWFAIFLPTGTDPVFIRKWNRVMNEVLVMPDIKEKILAQGAQAVGGPPSILATAVATEIPKWIKLVKDANIKAD